MPSQNKCGIAIRNRKKTLSRDRARSSATTSRIGCSFTRASFSLVCPASLVAIGPAGLCGGRRADTLGACGALRRRLHDTYPRARNERDPPPLDAVELWRGGRERASLEDARDYDAHLEQREARPDAAPRPAAERDPAVGVRRIVDEEALGPEATGLRIDVVARVHRHDRRVDLDPRRDRVAAELERLAPHHAADAGHHPPEAKGPLRERARIRWVPP